METPSACKLFVYDLAPSLFTSGFSSSKFCVCAVLYDMESLLQAWPPAEGLEFMSCNAVLLWVRSGCWLSLHTT